MVWATDAVARVRPEVGVQVGAQADAGHPGVGLGIDGVGRNVASPRIVGREELLTQQRRHATILQSLDLWCGGTRLPRRGCLQLLPEMREPSAKLCDK